MNLDSLNVSEKHLLTSPDGLEQLLWATLRIFEVQALAQYRMYGQSFSLQEKENLIAKLLSVAPSDTLFEGSELAQPMRSLLSNASVSSKLSTTLMVQGLILERLRYVIYDTLTENKYLTEESKGIARMGSQLSHSIVDLVPGVITREIGNGESLFALFAEVSDEILHQLDALGESVDRVFGERFGLKFSDLIGEFVSELLPACEKLGMNRRKVLSHLSGALMGL